MAAPVEGHLCRSIPVRRLLNSDLAGVEIVSMGNVKRKGAAQMFRESRLTIVASSRDANPQVISESLASGVPVAIAADISGGLFQVNPKAGERFAPNPLALARTLDGMLDGLDRYAPGDNCVTIDAAADQIESIIGQHLPKASGA
jgi:glycosyltransferase involved in cell wall biosynthesis